MYSADAGIDPLSRTSVFRLPIPTPNEFVSGPRLYVGAFSAVSLLYHNPLNPQLFTKVGPS